MRILLFQFKLLEMLAHFLPIPVVALQRLRRLGANFRDLAARGDRFSGCAAAKHVSAIDRRLAPVVKDPHLEPCEIGDRLPHDWGREAPAAADEIVVLQRLEVYHAQTEPVKEHYAALGKLRSVQGVGTVDEIRQRIFAALEL